MRLAACPRPASSTATPAVTATSPFASTAPGRTPFVPGEKLNSWQPDGTPLLCTAKKGSQGTLFYISGIHGAELAARINALAAAAPRPFFISVYGGLKWTASATDPKSEFWTMWADTLAALDEGIVPVGAQEMARLAREAGAREGA